MGRPKKWFCAQVLGLQPVWGVSISFHIGDSWMSDRSPRNLDTDTSMLGDFELLGIARMITTNSDVGQSRLLKLTFDIIKERDLHI
jgi:hypothetical protein